MVSEIAPWNASHISLAMHLQGLFDKVWVWTYQDLVGLPQGVEAKDAEELLPRETAKALLKRNRLWGAARCFHGAMRMHLCPDFVHHCSKGA